jgi:hypothetical protein
MSTYLTTNELSEKIKYGARTIIVQLKDSVLLEGVHYIRPFGGRKILYIWEEVETVSLAPHKAVIVLANIGVEIRQPTTKKGSAAYVAKRILKCSLILQEHRERY